MVMYLNAHIAIDQLRKRYESDGRIGVKVRGSVVVGYVSVIAELHIL